MFSKPFFVPQIKIYIFLSFSCGRPKWRARVYITRYICRSVGLLAHQSVGNTLLFRVSRAYFALLLLPRCLLNFFLSLPSRT